MKKLLTALDLEAISMGSTIFATGGAFSFSEQKRLLEGFKPYDSKVALWSVDEFPPEATFATVYGVGAAGASPDALEALIPKALDIVRQRYRKDIAGLFPGETGIEAFLFRAVSKLGIPVLDADGTGGRAVPEVRIDNFILAGISTLPLIALRDDGTGLYIEDPKVSGSELEALVRAFCNEAGGGSVLVMDHLCSPKIAKEHLSQGSISRSLETGLKLLGSEPLATVLPTIGARLIGEYKVETVSLERSNGFLAGKITLGNNQETLWIEVKNECLRISKNQQVLAQAPSLITLIDESLRCGVHNAELQMGQGVLVCEFEPEKRWSGKEAESFFWAP